MPRVSKQIWFVLKQLNKQVRQGTRREVEEESLLSQFRARLRQIALQFMFDEYEIVCWINFIDRFEFFNFCYDVNDIKQVIDSTFAHILYIAGAAKSVTNDDVEIKRVILSNVFGAQGIREFNKFIGHPDFGPKFDVLMDN
jgi:hypothetical protein